MNDAVYKLKRYEDSSLSYMGINKHEGEDTGLYDTVLTATDYIATFEKCIQEEGTVFARLNSPLFHSPFVTSNLAFPRDTVPSWL